MKKNKIKTYSGVDSMPLGNAEKKLTEGCLVLEGGAFRGVYTNGVIDALLEGGIKMQTVVGVSAGALNGMCYAAGNIGLAGRVNLLYRHDPRYVGRTAFQTDHGIMGYHFMFGQILRELKFDRETFMDPSHKFYAAYTNCLTGEMEYMEKSDPAIEAAVRASASMPLVSRMVDVKGIPCLDGGCSYKIPLNFALERDFEKIVVVCTRPQGYRRKENDRSLTLQKRLYRKYPEFGQAIADSSRKYNETCEKIDELEKEGRLFLIAPSKDLHIKRMEGDMEKLGELYYLGYNDTKKKLADLKTYLRKR